MFGLFSKKNKFIPLWFKTDIHNHVLPGIDDGSPDAETSVEIIKGMKELGIERIIASPHVAANEFPNTPETLAAAYSTLQEGLKEAQLDIPVSHSAEYRIDEDLMDIVENRQLVTYPGNYVLIENQWIQEPWNLEELIFDLQIKGYQPILAHPERFSYYHTKPERLDELHNKLPFQINVLSLAGYYGNKIRTMAEKLIKKGYADFLGTDIHSKTHVEFIKRYLSTSKALQHRELTINTIRNDRVFKG